MFFSSAQNDANFRKEKIHLLKEHGAKHASCEKLSDKSINRSTGNVSSALQSSNNQQFNRIQQEVEVLRKTNKQLADKVQVIETK